MSFYILPVMAAAAYGGLLPGLGATSASALAIVLVFLPHGALNPGSGLLLLLFLLDGLCISCLGKQMRAAIRTSHRVENRNIFASSSTRCAKRSNPILPSLGSS